jgi:hypothetical protein
LKEKIREAIKQHGIRKKARLVALAAADAERG